MSAHSPNRLHINPFIHSPSHPISGPWLIVSASVHVFKSWGQVRYLCPRQAAVNAGSPSRRKRSTESWQRSHFVIHTLLLPSLPQSSCDSCPHLSETFASISTILERSSPLSSREASFQHKKYPSRIFRNGYPGRCVLSLSPHSTLTCQSRWESLNFLGCLRVGQLFRAFKRWRMTILHFIASLQVTHW